MNNQIDIVKSLTKKIADDNENPNEVARLLATLLLEAVIENKIKDQMVFDICKAIKDEVEHVY